MRRAVLVVIIGVAALLLCGEADALFVGPAGSEKSGTDDDSGQEVVNPFDGSEATMPEATPESMRRRSSAWYNRPRNAKRFERLLRGDVELTTVMRVTEKPSDTAAAKVRKDKGSFLDYLLGGVVVVGLGAFGVLLFRARGSS